MPGTPDQHLFLDPGVVCIQRIGMCGGDQLVFCPVKEYDRHVYIRQLAQIIEPVFQNKPWE